MSCRTGVARIAGAALAGVLAVPLTLSGAAAADEPGQGEPWTLIDKRSSTKSGDAIGFGAPDDGWVVGANYETERTTPWAMHWDGTRWTESKVGNFGATPVFLDQVAVPRPGEAWATGMPEPAARTRSPRPGSGLPYRDARGVHPEAPAAGATAAEGTPYVLARWDGQSWVPAEAPKPPAGKQAQVSGLATVGDQVWAAGAEVKAGSTPSEQQAFIDRYADGTWQRMRLPEELTSKPSILLGVTGTGPDDVWLSGAFPTPQKDTPFAAHWDGKAFTVTELPVTADFPNGWNADEVAKLGDTVYVTGRSLYTDRTLVTGYRFDGTQWTEWKDRAISEVNDISVAPDGRSMVLGGWPAQNSNISEYATFDGSTWTRHAQPKELDKQGGQVLGVAHLPETDRSMAVGYVNAPDGSGFSYLTANKK